MKKRKLFLLRLVVAFLAAGFLVTEMWSFSLGNLGALLVFTVFAALSELMAIRLPQGGKASISMAILLPCLLLFPTPVPFLVAGAGVLVAAAARQKADRGSEILLRLAQRIVVVFGASTVFEMSGGTFGLIEIQRDFWAVCAASLTYFVLEIVFEQLTVVFEKEIPLFPSLVGLGTIVGPLYIAVASLGVLTGLMYDSMSHWSVALFFLPLLLTRHSFKLYFEIRKTYQQAIRALGKAIEVHNTSRYGHGGRVAEHSVAMGKELGLYWDDIENLSYAALLHDIGHLGADEDLPESDRAQATDKEKPARLGAEILEQVEFLRYAAPFVRFHQAPLGPSKRSADDSDHPLGARIIAVANSYDELTESVLSEERLSPRQAVNRIKKESGLRFDPRVVRALVKVLSVRQVLTISNQ